MKTTVYLVRHGQTDWNKEKKLQGWSDIPLNQSGIQEAELLSERLKNLSIHAVYSSPLLRAFHTAQIISRHHQLPIHMIDSLKEGGFGIFEGFTWAEVMAHPTITNRTGVINRFTEPLGGGESIYDIYTRTSKAVTDLVNNHPGQNILLVSHSLTIKTIAYHAGIVSQEDIDRLDIKNALLYHLDYNHSTQGFEAVDFPIVWRT